MHHHPENPYGNSRVTLTGILRTTGIPLSAPEVVKVIARCPRFLSDFSRLAAVLRTIAWGYRVVAEFADRPYN